MSSRAVIFTASIGAGQDLPARVLADALRARDATVEVVDGLELASPVARTIAGGASKLDSTVGELAFDAGHLLRTRVAPIRDAACAALDRLMRRGFETYLREQPADIVVSTYPLWSQLLGRMRDDGTLGTPVVSAITDLAALDLWAHRAIDLHLIAHPESAAEVDDIAGPDARIEAVQGLTDPAFTDPPERSVARTELGLPARGSLVVVCGGGRAPATCPRRPTPRCTTAPTPSSCSSATTSARASASRPHTPTTAASRSGAAPTGW